MILLDTNILSELMRSEPDRSVIEWLDKQFSTDLFICAITRAEIELGISLLQEGRRKVNLSVAAKKVFEGFPDRCLPFNEAASIKYANLVKVRTGIGRPISVEDAQIASIALVHDLTLATRNTSDFDNIAELRVINPWHEK